MLVIDMPPGFAFRSEFYIWKKKYGVLGANEVRRLRHLEEETAR